MPDHDDFADAMDPIRDLLDLQTLMEKTAGWATPQANATQKAARARIEHLHDRAMERLAGC